MVCPLYSDQMQSIIDKMDVPPKQIHTAVKLVELSDEDAVRIGEDWCGAPPNLK